MDGLLPLLIPLASGAAGGNIAGYLLKSSSLGILGNSIAGILGGGIGSQLLSLLGIATGTGGTDAASIVGSVGAGGVGGGALLAIIGAVRNAMAR